MKKNDGSVLVMVKEDRDGLVFNLDVGAAKPLIVRPEFQKRKEIGTRQDLLARAIGFKKNLFLSVLDLTAGLARDSFHMACLGCNVTALEHQPDLYRVVSTTWQRHRAILKPPASLNFVEAEASEYLKDCRTFDAIYFDPMFPEKKKSAKPGKESQLLQALGFMDPKNEARILELARKKSRRVVVKRPAHAPEIGGVKPDAVYDGQAVRYDVYIAADLDVESEE